MALVRHMLDMEPAVWLDKVSAFLESGWDTVRHHLAVVELVGAELMILLKNISIHCQTHCVIIYTPNAFFVSILLLG